MARGWSWSGLRALTGMSTLALAAVIFGACITMVLIIIAIAYVAINGGYQFPNVGRPLTIAVATLFLLMLLLISILGRRISFNK